MDNCPFCGAHLNAPFQFVNNLTLEDFDSVRHLLPETAYELICVVGGQKAVEIIIRFGGQRLLIGKQNNSRGRKLTQQLGELVGEDAALRLSYAFGDQRCFVVPKCRAALHELRNRAVRKSFDELYNQYSYNELLNVIATKFNMSQRSVNKALSHADSLPSVNQPKIHKIKPSETAINGDLFGF